MYVRKKREVIAIAFPILHNFDGNNDDDASIGSSGPGVFCSDSK